MPSLNTVCCSSYQRILKTADTSKADKVYFSHPRGNSAYITHSTPALYLRVPNLIWKPDSKLCSNLGQAGARTLRWTHIGPKRASRITASRIHRVVRLCSVTFCIVLLCSGLFHLLFHSYSESTPASDLTEHDRT